jgi:YD repeat-containing protein
VAAHWSDVNGGKGIHLLPNQNAAWQSISFPSQVLATPLADRLEVIAGSAPVPNNQVGVGSECQCHTAQPVNTRSGNFWTTATDLSVATPGPELTWSRVYASQALSDTSSVLGVGWQHRYGARLILPGMPGGEAGLVIVLTSETNRERFADPGTGTNRPFPGVTSMLVRANGVYTQTLQDQRQLIFDDTSGLLLATRDALGRRVELTYNTATPPQLLQVADANDLSRTLTLTYTNGLISSVGDGTRTVEYAYDSAGNLTDVTDVMGRTTSYTYQTPSNQLLTAITNPLGQLVEQMTYDSATPPRVQTQVLQDGRQLQFQYLAATTVLTTTGIDGRQDVQHFDYAADNTIAGITSNGQPLQARAHDANYKPALLSDGEGHTTATTYNAQGLPIAQTNALSQTTLVEYDDANRPTIITDTLGVATHYTYDALGNLLISTAGVTTTSALRHTTLYTYTYDLRYAGDSLLQEQRSADGVVTRYDYNARARSSPRPSATARRSRSSRPMATTRSAA